MYKKELEAIKKSNRFRQRVIYDDSLTDLASNDYLGLSENSDLLDKAYKRVKNYRYHSPRASQLVNGYHPLHRLLEDYLCELNDFESAIIVGSGFLANLSLIESLPRKKDLLILDEFYHARGVLAYKLIDTRVEFFKHNSSKDLESILQQSRNYSRIIVAVEGIYSMDADILNRDIFDLCDRYSAILIVDEAHSAGVIGNNFLGVFDYYNITPKANHIKMGTR
jgi:8-amino-7-oxononanoate synthase